MVKQDLTKGFQNVDNSQHQFLIEFLEDAGRLPQVLECFELQLKWLDIKKGNYVLDIGCGIGLQAQSMAKLVGAGGKVAGTDLSSVMIDIAKSKTASSNLPLEFFVANAIQQPFPDQSFDCIRIERVLMYIKDIPAVLEEFKRLLKPNGKIVAFDFDWDAIVIAHTDKTLTRKIVRYVSDSFPNGRIGGELFRYLKDAGFKDVSAKPFCYSGDNHILLDITKRIYEGILQTGISNNIFTEKEIADWWQVLEKDVREGDFFASFQGFIVGGTK
ncbi:MAG: methyltransferase domain-containing protein [Sphingobacteriales bacterium]